MSTIPTISTISQSQGTPSGGQFVSITGTNLTGVTVTIAAVSVINPVVTNGTLLTFNTPPGQPGAANLMIVNSSGNAIVTYTYSATAPYIALTVPNYGSTVGGQLVTITGTNLTGATVAIGDIPAIVLSSSSTEVKCYTPAAVSATTVTTTVNLIVTTNPTGSNPIGSNTIPYIYSTTAPSISTISPSSGTSAGGTPIIISGNNYLAGATVAIGGKGATNVSTTSSSITCTTPAGTVGDADLIVIAGNYGQTWEEVSTAGGLQVAISSATGQYQTAVNPNDGLYVSSDFGKSWTNTSPDKYIDWTGVAVGGTGQYQTAVSYGQTQGSFTAYGIWRSSNYGASWAQCSPFAGPASWRTVSISLDGQVQTAVINGGSIWTSTNAGVTWLQSISGTPNCTLPAPTTAAWQSVSVSSDGSQQTAVVYGGGIYTSIDGLNWTLQTAVTGLTSSSPAWYSVSISSNGSVQAAVIPNVGIYLSTNTGVNWAPAAGSFVAGWKCISISGDGTFQTAVTSNAAIYVSSNKGSTFTKVLSPTSGYNSVSISSSGMYQTASGVVGNIYTSATSSNALKYTYTGTPTPTPVPVPTPTPVPVPTPTPVPVPTPTPVPTPVPVPTPTPFATSPVISDICFPAGTPITTDQGNIPIEQINPDIHTIRNNQIVAITKTITQDTHLVCFEKHSLGHNKPNKKTITSKLHKVYYDGKMTQANHFLKQEFKNVSKVDYNGEILYNVLMEKYDKVKVNNLTVETLDPENIIAKLYTSGYDDEYKNKIIVMINYSITQKDTGLYQNIINRIINDKNVNTCFEEPEYNNLDEDDTTRIETIDNYAEKSHRNQDIDFKANINLENNTQLQSKLTKYIKTQQNKDDVESVDFKVTVNLENNMPLQSKLNKYIKSHQTKDNTDEIVKKKEFLNKKKEETEEKLRERLKDNEKRRDKTQTQRVKMRHPMTLSTSRKTYKSFFKFD
jgi:hypothetical protein